MSALTKAFAKPLRPLKGGTRVQYTPPAEASRPDIDDRDDEEEIAVPVTRKEAPATMAKGATAQARGALGAQARNHVHAPGARCAVDGCTNPPRSWFEKLPEPLRGLCAKHRKSAQDFRLQRGLSPEDAFARVAAKARGEERPAPAPKLSANVASQELAELALVREERDALAREKAQLVADVATQREALDTVQREVAELRAALTNARAVIASPSPWERLVVLARAVRGGAETWWSVCSYTGPGLPNGGTGWVVEGHDCDDDPEGKHPLWAGYGWTVDGAIAAAVRKLEEAARQRVAELTAALGDA